MTKILGLTGGIASGKTTVSDYLKSLDIPVVDADVVARKVMSAGAPVIEEIKTEFGEAVIREDGEINREVLGKIVFASPEKRKKLDSIVQSEIRKELIREKEMLVEEGYPLVVLDIPLLYETGYEQEVEQVMVVFVDQAVQTERLLNRNPELSEEDALNRIHSQIPLAEKAKLADIVIDNNGTVDQTLDQVNKWLSLNFPTFLEKK